MTQGPPVTRQQLVVDRDEHDERRQAQLVVASYATDATDLAGLLDMLGLGRAEPLCLECGLPMSHRSPDGYHRPGNEGFCWQCWPAVSRREAGPARTRCACGRGVAEGSEQCHLCANFVAIEDVRELVAELQGMTGLGVAALAVAAGITSSTLVDSMHAGRTKQRFSREAYAKLVQLVKTATDDPQALWDRVPPTTAIPIEPIREYLMRLRREQHVPIYIIARRSGLPRSTINNILSTSPKARVRKYIADAILAAHLTGTATDSPEVR